MNRDKRLLAELNKHPAGAALLKQLGYVPRRRGRPSVPAAAYVEVALRVGAELKIDALKGVDQYRALNRFLGRRSNQEFLKSLGLKINSAGSLREAAYKGRTILENWRRGIVAPRNIAGPVTAKPKDWPLLQAAACRALSIETPFAFKGLGD